MNVRKVYIYPTYSAPRNQSGNNYIKYFRDSFKNNTNCRVVNRYWQVGISSLYFNLDAELFIIHWIDLIMYLRMGKIQVVLFLMAIVLLKLSNKKIIWVLHNKHAHRGKNQLVKFIMYFMANCSNIVITHSYEGTTFFLEKYGPKCLSKIHYIPHPVYNINIIKSQDIIWDYIIWGNIDRRKQIFEFLCFIDGSLFFSNKKILICGNCIDKEYEKQISNKLASNITFVNKFLTENELNNYISQSKHILFTYNPDSLLSSGALIYSLNFSKSIIGPSAGNFADLKGIVACYHSFEEIPYIKTDECQINKLTKEYIKNNTWEKFPKKILEFIK